MIIVTRLDGRHFAVNPDLIARIFESPDTILVMADGARFIVTEPMAEVIEKIASFRAQVISVAYNDAPGPAKRSSHLSIIHPADPSGPITGGQ
ncbi:flagellar protein FlbD [Arthrobacter livingstonensis]|uniref:Flagellar protein FlbD n=1 Tax=Arthrobacter livingstonensis TaxID=670078 RepID=A0A2V5LAS8_9MICC|nr:flagellar FlbD family protein [Arthrobacter livingstonensis]PYI66863.1 flagellar protein FlbD [Arthrobacter livingstonensis]